MDQEPQYDPLLGTRSNFYNSAIGLFDLIYWIMTIQAIIMVVICIGLFSLAAVSLGKILEFLSQLGLYRF